jgi:hypothetical protein
MRHYRLKPEMVVGKGGVMSAKEWVVFVIGCLALGVGLLFGQGGQTAATNEQHTIYITQEAQHSSIIGSTIFTRFDGN